MKKSTDTQPRRDFLKLAAFTSAAALTGKAAPAPAGKFNTLSSAESHQADTAMEFLHVSGAHIVDTKGEKVRLRGTCPGGWMNMEDFINGHPGASFADGRSPRPC